MLVMVGAMALGMSSAHASGVACAGCSGTYMGSWSAQIQSSGPDGTVMSSLSLSWTETLTTAAGSGTGVWSLTSARGTICTPAPIPGVDCTATLSPSAIAGG